MSDATVIVWDLETVPDLRAAARMLNMEQAADEDVWTVLGEASQASLAAGNCVAFEF
jgi:hypothetical protein